MIINLRRITTTIMSIILRITIVIIIVIIICNYCLPRFHDFFSVFEIPQKIFPVAKNIFFFEG